MEKYPFLFSDALPHRMRRHFCFWLAWWVFHSFLYSFSAGVLSVEYFDRLPVAAAEALVYLLPHMFLAYSLIYGVIPLLLLKGKYLQTMVAVPVLFLLTGAFSSLISVYVLQYFRAFLLPGTQVRPHSNEVHFFLGLLSGLRGGITAGGIAAAIKLTKHWYVKEQRNLQLQKENVSAQLQLLKAQVHPHFLFNTLNNIYATTQTSSPEASGLITGLSGILRYMLYECNQPVILLTRELQMLQAYISLEQARYDQSLDLHIEMPGNETGLLIAPLLLLPFVENSFKHGTSQVLDQPWISLKITVDDDWLKMKLVNGKSGVAPGETGGIGLQNVATRLQLLYPQKHELVVNNEEEVFIVNLRIQLQKSDLATVPKPDPLTAPAYA